MNTIDVLVSGMVGACLLHIYNSEKNRTLIRQPVGALVGQGNPAFLGQKDRTSSYHARFSVN